MIILLLAYVGGVLTIFSPCVLPVIPFIFSRSDQPFRKAGLPMLIGMGVSFAIFSAFSVAGAQWVVHANQYGRIIALVVFTILGLSLLFPTLTQKLSAPLVNLGNKLQQKTDGGSVGSSFILGTSVGLLWAPCAGPILGLLLAGASLGTSSRQTLGLLFVFAAGAASSLAVAIFAGNKVLRTLKKGLGAEEWIKRGLGLAVLVAVFAIGFGYDTRLLSTFSYINTNKIEETLVSKASFRKPSVSNIRLQDEGALPSLAGAVEWLNSPPLTNESLKGKVVLIDFWTYSCINCLRTLPHVKMWAEKYRDRGLVVIGVHSPEFAFERDVKNVKKAVADLGITYPVAVDSHQTIWNAFENLYWPAHYFVDARGRIRFHHFGEGNYEESEKVIQQLLEETNPTKKAAAQQGTFSSVKGEGVQAPTSFIHVDSPETYLGYDRQEGFMSTSKIIQNKPQAYQSPKNLNQNQWSLDGTWNIGEEMTVLTSTKGTLTYQFRANDVHLVLGSVKNKPIRFQVMLDGKVPGEDHGVDIDAEGYGVISDHRLYQLVRQKSNVRSRTFTITFFEPGVQAFAFTFG